MRVHLERTSSTKSQSPPPLQRVHKKHETEAPPMEPVFVQVDTIKYKDVFVSKILLCVIINTDIVTVRKCVIINTDIVTVRKSRP